MSCTEFEVEFYLSNLRLKALINTSIELSEMGKRMIEDDFNYTSIPFRRDGEAG